MPKKSKIEKQVNENALKHIFDQKLLKRIAHALIRVYPVFDQKKFLDILPELLKLEMKPRVYLIRDRLQELLPPDFPKALKVILQSLKSGELDGFVLWPYTEYIQTYGLEHVKMSLDGLKEITPHFTSEWAVRPFIRLHPKVTMKYLEACAKDKNEHVRRWASEGSRPRLPWGERLQDFVKNPALTRRILELLKFDSALYVRKSISNHLNDIAKDHPEWVVKILAEWQKKSGKKHADKIKWIIHRSLRTLIKNGHPDALRLIGVSQPVQIKLQNFKLQEKEIKLGEHLNFEFEIVSLSEKTQKLVVDYSVHFVKSNKKTSPKVFKLKTTELLAKQVMKIQKNHHLKKITTRKYYPGLHKLEIQVNGRSLIKYEWVLRLS